MATLGSSGCTQAVPARAVMASSAAKRLRRSVSDSSFTILLLRLLGGAFLLCGQVCLGCVGVTEGQTGHQGHGPDGGRLHGREPSAEGPGELLGDARQHEVVVV